MTAAHSDSSADHSRPVEWLLHEPAPNARLAALKWHPWLVVATVCVGAFMGQLDASIVSLALPTLEETFHSSVNSVQWVAIIYLLVLTGLLTPLGRVADQLGRKALYTLGFLVFVGGSALCGLAPSLTVLILARATQGVGAAMLQANSVAIITAAVPRIKLGRAIGVQGTAQALGLALGPTVGGLLIGWIGWRWVFLVNLPVGLLGALLAVVVLPRTAQRGPATGFNRRGAVLLPAGVAALLLALTFIHLAVVLLPLAALCAWLFVRSEHAAREPLLGAEVLRAPGLAPGMLAGLLSYCVLFGGLFAVPLLLERVFSYSPARAGLLLTVVPLLLASVALLGGALSDRVGPRLPTVGGMLLASLGLALIYWGAAQRLPILLAGLALLGLGSGLFIPANNASVMGVAPRARLGVAGGLLNMMRGLGTSLGVALVGLVLTLNLHGASTDATAGDAVLHSLRWTLLCLGAAAVAACVLSFRRQPSDLTRRMDTGELV
jgi:EmrB/QacA subfamily drug resistance transporter